jgi:hypothetical protein
MSAINPMAFCRRLKNIFRLEWIPTTKCCPFEAAITVGLSTLNSNLCQMRELKSDHREKICLVNSSWASDRVDRVGQGISTKVNNFRSSGNTHKVPPAGYCIKTKDLEWIKGFYNT